MTPESPRGAHRLALVQPRPARRRVGGGARRALPAPFWRAPWPARPPSLELSLVTEEERRQLLAEGPRPLFERHARPGSRTRREDGPGSLAGARRPPRQRLTAEGRSTSACLGPSGVRAGRLPVPWRRLGARLSGGSLVASEEPAVLPRPWRRLVKERRVTVPACPRRCSRISRPGWRRRRRDAGLRSLRWVVVDGKPAAAALRAWQGALPGERQARVLEGSDAW